MQVNSVGWGIFFLIAHIVAPAATQEAKMAAIEPNGPPPINNSAANIFAMISKRNKRQRPT